MRFPILFLLPPVAMLLAGCSANSGPPPIVIGHVSDKTRADKAGDQAEFGIRLALNHLNNDSLAAELGGRKLEVRHTDARGHLDAFESQAVRLESVNRAIALLGGNSPAEAAALQNAKVPILTLHGQPLPGAANLVFCLGISPLRQGVLLARFLGQEADTTRITVVVEEKRPESSLTQEAFQKTLAQVRETAKTASASVQVVRLRPGEEALKLATPGGVSLTVPPKSNPAEELARIRDLAKQVVDQNPQTVVFAGTVHTFNVWRKEILANEKFKPRIVFAGDDGDHRVFDRDDLKGEVILATAFWPDPASEKIAAFMKSYRDAFKTDPDVHAALSYDGFRMLVEAMKRTPTQLTPEKLREELLKIKDFAGLTGPLTMTTDRQVQRPAFIARWQDGQLTSLKAFSGTEKD